VIWAPFSAQCHPERVEAGINGFPLPPSGFLHDVGRDISPNS
jgi:hypothetical protein